MTGDPGWAGSAGFDGYRFAASVMERYDAIGCGEQRIVLADSDIGPGMEFGAALANDNIACLNRLATEPFDAQSFRFGVPSVFCGSATFFMCHDSVELCGYLFNLDTGQVAAMSARNLIALATFFPEYDDLVAFHLVDDFGIDLGVLESG